MAFPIGICLWTQQASWAEIEEAAVLVDELGFDHLWTVDHLLAPQGAPDQPILEGFSVLSAWAGLTQQVRLGLFVAANPFREPTMTAKLATTLDHISDGRAIVGLGAGWFEREHAAYGLEFGASPGERIGWLDESAGIVRRLLDGERVTSLDGRYRVDDLQLLPRPVQSHLPITIGGSGEKRTLRTVAQHADIWNAFGTPEILQHKIRVLDGHCRDVGRSIGDIELTIGGSIIIGRNRDEAERIYADQMANNETTDANNVSAEYQRWLGTVDDTVDRIESYIDVGMQGLVVEMAAPFHLETLRALAEEVRPRLK